MRPLFVPRRPSRPTTFLVATTLAVAALAACERKAPPQALSTSGSASTPAPPASSPSAPSASVAAAAPLPPREERFSPAGMLAEAGRYIDDAAFRRAALESSLVNHKNTYSRQRLEHYGVTTRGWELLPEWNPTSLPVTTEVVAKIRKHETLTVDASTPPLWDGKRPTTMEGWVALGREVFFGYPLRSEVYMRWALEHPEMAEKIGIKAGKDGVVPGARLFLDVDGNATIGITCAVCHTTVEPSGRVVVGEARRAFDYGALRLAYHDATKIPVAADLVRRMKTWGPGRADVTEDDDEDPVAIPDLWGLRHQTFLTQAGTIKHDGPTALALRQETQLLHSNHQKIRPPRVLAYALTMFLYSLEPPAHEGPKPPAPKVARGKELFEKHCESCHSNAAYGGPPIVADKVGTDPALANGGARGTGKYRPAALVRVDRAAPYFHQGAVPTLADVLSPDRLGASYARGTLGKGPVAGHTFGTDLPRADRDALVAFLETL
ncbi:MAG: c-type cytochrome [Deltaproteobacteria bacterium]|nr:c-type cytochrome [Deltaproteobacteria bacterium]